MLVTMARAGLFGLLRVPRGGPNSISSDQMNTQPELFVLDGILASDSDSDSSDEDSSCCSTMSLTSSEGEEFDSLDECLEAYSLAEYIRSQHNKNKRR